MTTKTQKQFRLDNLTVTRLHALADKLDLTETAVVTHAIGMMAAAQSIDPWPLADELVAYAESQRGAADNALQGILQFAQSNPGGDMDMVAKLAADGLRGGS